MYCVQGTHEQSATFKNRVIMAKFLTKKDLKGIKFTQDIEWLLDDINRKGEINGRYFSCWWFDHFYQGADRVAMNEIIYTLIANWIKANGSVFNCGADGACRLSQAAAYVADKLNVFESTIVKVLRTMYYCGYQNVIVEDHWGLDSLTVLNINRN